MSRQDVSEMSREEFRLYAQQQIDEARRRQKRPLDDDDEESAGATKYARTGTRPVQIPPRFLANMQPGDWKNKELLHRMSPRQLFRICAASKSTLAFCRQDPVLRSRLEWVQGIINQLAPLMKRYRSGELTFAQLVEQVINLRAGLEFEEGTEQKHMLDRIQGSKTYALGTPLLEARFSTVFPEISGVAKIAMIPDLADQQSFKFQIITIKITGINPNLQPTVFQNVERDLFNILNPDGNKIVFEVVDEDFHSSDDDTDDDEHKAEDSNHQMIGRAMVKYFVNVPEAIQLLSRAERSNLEKFQRTMTK